MRIYSAARPACLVPHLLVLLSLLLAAGCAHKSGGGSIDPNLVGKWTYVRPNVQSDVLQCNTNGTYSDVNTSLPAHLHTTVGTGVYTASGGTLTQRVINYSDNGKALPSENNATPIPAQYSISGDTLSLTMGGDTLTYSREK